MDARNGIDASCERSRSERRSGKRDLLGKLKGMRVGEV